MSDVTLRAQVLAEALPYIQKYYGKAIVIKYGGSAMISRELREAVIGDVILLSLVGIHVVVVRRRAEICHVEKKLGKESRFVDGPALYRRRDHGRGAAGALRQGEQEPGGHPQPPGRAGHRPVRLGRRSVQARLLDAKCGLVGRLARVNPPGRDFA